MMVQAQGGFEYFIIFTNNYLRYEYIYMIRYKSKAFTKFKQFKTEVENQLKKRIKTVRSNHGGEYLLGEYK